MERQQTQFSRQNDPYKFLGVPISASLEDIRAAFKQKALIHHPDRGGNPKDFIKLKSAYKYLFTYKTNQLKEMKKTAAPVKHLRKQEMKSRTQLDKELKTTLGGENPFDLRSNNKDDFNKKFNRMFESNKLDDPFQRGYEIERQDVAGKRIDAGDLVKNIDHKNVEKRAIDVYKEPEPVDVSGDYYQYGVDRVNDFSDNGANKRFSDYMDAYTNRESFETMSNVRKSYKNVTDYKSARNRTMDNLEQDADYLRTKEMQEQEEEEMRRYRLAEYDRIANQNFNRINNRLTF